MKKLTIVFTLFYFFGFGQENMVWMNPNRGQWHENIKYKVDLQSGEFLLEQTGFTYFFHNIGDLLHHDEEHNSHQTHDKYRAHVIKTEFIGSNQNHSAIESKTSDFYRNYFIGTDENKWKSNVHAFSEVTYTDFYANIDLVFEGKESSFKYSFLVKPQANAEEIKYKIDGSPNYFIDKNGNLNILHEFGTIQESKPVVWNIDEKGNKIPVKAKFKIKKNIISFEFPDGYNENQLLVIDPSITFSTYTGSTADNWGCTATPDMQGNLYAGGTVFGAGYPTTAGAFDASFGGGDNIGYSGFDCAISKFNSTGTAFLYSTYLGGSGSECPNSMITNAAGELYILGVTSSSNFPMSAGSYDNSFNGGSQIELFQTLAFFGTDIFIARINPGGTALMSSTYIGGTNNDGINPDDTFNPNGDLVYNYGDNYRGEIIFDNSGNVLVASSTRSTNFPTVTPSQAVLNGVQDAVLFKMNANLSSLLWSTFYGGSGIDTGNSLDVNSLNEVYLSGGTRSNNLNVPAGHSTVFAGETDGYVTRFNGTNGSVLSGTYIGTVSYDQNFFVQVDPNDFVYCYGQSEGIMPMSPGTVGNPNAQQYIRKFATNLSSVVWNTKIGGSDEKISPTAFSISNCFEIYFAGWGGSNLGSNISNFMTTPDAFQTTTNGDAFYIAVLDPDATAVQYATFMGGPSGDHVDGGTSRFDREGNIYHAVCSACGGDANGFVSTPGVVSNTNNSNNCNLAAFKFQLNSIVPIAATPGVIICIPNPVLFENNSIGGDTYLWRFGDGNTSSQFEPSYVYQAPGDYTVTLIVSDSQGCQAPDSVSVDITIGSFEAGSIAQPPTICKGDSYQLEATGGLTYVWTPANVLDNPNIANPTATVFQTTTFSVIVSDACGSDTVTVTLPVFNDAITVSPDTSLCIGNSTQIEVFGAATQVWTPNTFISNNLAQNPTVTPNSTTTYLVTATTINGCVFEDSVLVDIFDTPPTPNIQDTATMCFGAFLDVTVSGASTYLWSPNQNINTISGATVRLTPTNDFTYYCDFTNACGTLRDSIFVDVIRPNVRAFKDTIICLGDSALMYATGGVNYSWSPSGSLNNNVGDSVLAFPQVSTQYMVIGTDQFFCRDTAYINIQLYPTHQVYAGGDVVTAIGIPVQLNATSGSVGSYTWLPNSFLSCSICQDPIANPNYNFSYQVVFTDTNGCKTIDFLDINYKGILYIPNTFTPDGSRFNEVFKAYGEGIITFEMLIFDRWGELIYSMDSMDDYWDGTYKGKICQDGTYTWKLKYTDITEEVKHVTGHVNLLK